MIDSPPEAVEAFIARWENSGAAERANYQMFLAELCDVTLLKQLHEDLDEAVLEAYGWSDLKGSAGVPPAAEPQPSGRDARAPFEEELLTRLVALNHARAAEEKSGHIRWLRPDYQNKNGDHRPPQQTTLDVDTDTSTIKNPQSSLINQTLDWPAKLPDQVRLIRHLLATNPTATPEQLSSHFGRKNAKRTEQIDGIVETLRGLGKV